MKKRLFAIISAVVLVCIAFTSFAACSQSESEYYDGINASVDKYSETYASLYENLKNANFRTEFTAFRNYADTAVRGSSSSAGGEQEYTGADGEATTDWIVDYAVVKYVQNTSSNYWLQITKYTAITEDMYDKLSKGKDVEGIDAYKDVTTIELKDGVMYYDGEAKPEMPVIDGMTMLRVPMTFDKERSLGVTDGNKIYTRIMQSSERSVYLIPETGAENVNIYNLNQGKEVLKADNDAATAKYWDNFGEDITYDWEQVAGMINTRDTFSYNKKHARIDQIDLYTEVVLAFYDKKNEIDSTLTLKARVFSQESTVIDIEYPKDGAFEVKAF